MERLDPHSDKVASAHADSPSTFGAMWRSLCASISAIGQQILGGCHQLWTALSCCCLRSRNVTPVDSSSASPNAPPRLPTTPIIPLLAPPSVDLSLDLTTPPLPPSAANSLDVAPDVTPPAPIREDTRDASLPQLPSIGESSASSSSSAPEPALAAPSLQSLEFARRVETAKHENNDALQRARKDFIGDLRGVALLRCLNPGADDGERIPIFSEIRLTDDTTITDEDIIGFLCLLIEESDLSAEGKKTARTQLAAALNRCINSQQMSDNQKLDQIIMAVQEAVMQGPKKSSWDRFFDAIYLESQQYLGDLLQQTTVEQFMRWKNDQRHPIGSLRNMLLDQKTRNYFLVGELLDKLPNGKVDEQTLEGLYALRLHFHPAAREAFIKVIITALETYTRSNATDDEKLEQLLKDIFLSDIFLVHSLCSQYGLEPEFVVLFNVLSQDRKQQFLTGAADQLNDRMTRLEARCVLRDIQGRLLDEQILEKMREEEQQREEQDRQNRFQFTKPLEEERKAALEILQLNPNDPYSIEAVKKQYRRLVLQNHPDKNPGNAEAEVRFKAVQAAWENYEEISRRMASSK